MRISTRRDNLWRRQFQISETFPRCPYASAVHTGTSYVINRSKNPYINVTIWLDHSKEWGIEKSIHGTKS
jgi:hypothetical protein